MEVLINELSLKGQYVSIEDFLENGLNVMLPVLNAFSVDDSICKTYNFYDQKVTYDITIHNVLVGDYSRTVDEIRKYKSLFSKLFIEPYWEDNPKHSSGINYSYNQTKVTGTSIAEACEREQILLSFNNGGFNTKSLDIGKEVNVITVINLRHQQDLGDLVGDDEIILFDETRFNRTSLVRQGKAVFQEISSGNYWYLDNLHKNHFEVFNANEEHLGTANLEGNMISDAKKGRRL